MKRKYSAASVVAVELRFRPEYSFRSTAAELYDVFKGDRSAVAAVDRLLSGESEEVEIMSDVGMASVARLAHKAPL